MPSRLPEAPVIQSSVGVVDGLQYNRIRLALGSLSLPVEECLGIRGFDVVLDRRDWVCFDRRLNGAPVLAWTAFAPWRRHGLLDPVPCHLIYYHPYAAVVVRTLLDDVERRLVSRLPPVQTSRIASFHRS